MKLLKIKEGVCINIDKVEALENIDQFNTRIYMTNGGVYEAMLPYDSLINIIESEGSKKEEVFKRVNAVAKTAGYFAG